MSNDYLNLIKNLAEIKKCGVINFDYLRNEDNFYPRKGFKEKYLKKL